MTEGKPSRKRESAAPVAELGKRTRISGPETAKEEINVLEYWDQGSVLELQMALLM